MRTATILLACALLACGSQGRATGGDAGDVEPEGEEPGDAPAEPVPDADEEEPVEPGCGNGIVEPGETCDDGNAVNEPCDTTDPDACLADCSLLVASCGDGELDPGEQCDDGDEDSHDDCTTSCTDNVHTIGDPCTCEGDLCNDVDLAAGTIVGCENAEMFANVSRELACLRSVNLGYDLHFAEGYCTLLAFRCEGDLCTTLDAREIGDVDTFSCPAGFARVTRVDHVLTMTVTTKTCHPMCTSPSECRWNADEDPSSSFTGCGHYDCIARGDYGELVCLDARNP